MRVSYDPRLIGKRDGLDDICVSYDIASETKMLGSWAVAAQILPFPKSATGVASPIACFVRVGEARRRLADLHATGHLLARHVVIEVSRFRHQREFLLVSAKGGARLRGCGDRTCCPHGYRDMVADPRRHAAHQLFKSISPLEAVPDLRRETQFLDGPMAEADRLARQIKALRPTSTEAEKLGVDGESLMKRLEQHSRRLEKLQVMLERLHETRARKGRAPCQRESED